MRARALVLLVALGAASAPGRAEEAGTPPSAPTSGPATAPVRFTLPELLAKAHAAYPGILASRDALAAAEARLSEARRAYFPQGAIDGLVAPAPRIDCNAPDDLVTTTPEAQRDQRWREEHCLITPSLPTQRLVGIDGVFLRFEINGALPVYTFGKLSAAVSAARAGVLAGEGKVAQSRAQVELDVRRAYYGIKLAREIMQTIDEGRGHLDKALDKVKKDLEEGTGASTVTDLRRLQVLAADIATRKLEVVRGEAVARAGLRALVPGLPVGFAIDTEPLEESAEPAARLADYLEQARRRRPEVQLLDAALDARRADLNLQRASFYPDLLLVGRFTYAYTSSVDVPRNGFYSNPFNGLGGGGGLALRLKWDYALKAARLKRARAELSATAAGRAQALLGIGLEVEKAWSDVDEARKRADETQRGERIANAWLLAVSQKFALGLAETRDFSDALVAFFQMRLRWLQSLYDSQVARASLARAAGGE